MKVTIENHIETLPSEDLLLFTALLQDLAEINSKISSPLYIDYNLNHTEYSPEWTDPCPDYYGMYSLRPENNPSELIGDYMTLQDLDMALFIVCDFLNSQENE